MHFSARNSLSVSGHALGKWTMVVGKWTMVSNNIVFIDYTNAKWMHRLFTQHEMYKNMSQFQNKTKIAKISINSIP